jgi:ubiquinone/menaquinone biosynthesis C-methylase UbiE
MKERGGITDTLRSIWDACAPFYVESFGTVGVSRGFAENLEACLLPIRGRGGMVLDGGCGAGLSFERIIRTINPSKLVGLDFSPEMLRRANEMRRKLAQRYNCQIELRETDLCEGIPFPENTFKLQVFQVVLYYLPAGMWRNVLREAFRVAEPGGYVISSSVLQGFNFRREVGVWSVFKDVFTHPKAVFLTATKLRHTLAKFQDLAKEGTLRYPTEEELIEFHRSLGFEELVSKPIWNKTIMIGARKPT